MPNIVLTRIDNRLIHGQVGMFLVGHCGANLIVVADDEAANDPILQQVMKMTADSANVGVRFFSIQQTIDTIHKASEAQKILLVVKNPQALRALVEGGVPVKEVNIGNMHVSAGKRKNAEPHVYVDDQDIADLAYVRDQGAEIYIQMDFQARRYEFDFNG